MLPIPVIEVIPTSAIPALGGSEAAFDSCVFVFTPEFSKSGGVENCSQVFGGSSSTAGYFKHMAELMVKDKAFSKEVSLSMLGDGSVLVSSPTGPLSRDYDDVRRYADATAKAIKRLRQGGFRRPLLMVQGPQESSAEGACDPLKDFSKYLEVSLLAALAEAHEPLQTRESNPSYVQETLIERIGIVGESQERIGEALAFCEAVEEGRRLARDVGSSDPERMTSLRAAEYIEEYFRGIEGGANVSCSLVKDAQILSKEYPLLMAVARASMHVPRHAPCVVELEYRSPDQSAVLEELYFVGKGINYDTGGADLKVGGNMVGMSRDKCGAAAVAGLIATAAKLKPLHVNIRARLAFVRNSIGPDSYVADEIITSRAGVRVRVGNTDAEGRMVMADLLARAKEEALASTSWEKARLFTVATLTGHVRLSYGPYAAVIDNAAARSRNVASTLFRTSLATGDPFELSTLRREDFVIIAPTETTQDVLQCNRTSSIGTSRGHQYPMAFMLTAAGLTSPKKGKVCLISVTFINLFRN
jgi:leucyl aminopeptidase